MFEGSSGNKPLTTKLSRVTTTAGLQGVNRVNSSLPLPILYSTQKVGEQRASHCNPTVSGFVLQTATFLYPKAVYSLLKLRM